MKCCSRSNPSLTTDFTEAEAPQITAANPALTQDFTEAEASRISKRIEIGKNKSKSVASDGFTEAEASQISKRVWGCRDYE